MYTIIRIILISSVILIVAACGKDPGRPDQNAVRNRTVVPQRPTDNQPVVDTNTDQPAPTKHKKHKTVVKTEPAQPQPAPAPAASAVPAPVQPEAPITEQPAPTPTPAKYVVGLISANSTPDQLFDRGLESAIFEARVCSIRGEFSDGSRCFAVFSDGSTDFVTSSNRDAVLTFIAQLQEELKAQKAAQEASKKAAKAAKKAKKNK